MQVVVDVPPGIDLAKRPATSHTLPIQRRFGKPGLRDVRRVGGPVDRPSGLRDPYRLSFHPGHDLLVCPCHVGRAVSRRYVFPVGIVVHADEIDVRQQPLPVVLVQPDLPRVDVADGFAEGVLGEHLSRPTDVFLDVRHTVAYAVGAVVARAVEILAPDADAVDQICEFGAVGGYGGVESARFFGEVGVPLTCEEAEEEGGVGGDGVFDCGDGTSGGGVYHCVEAGGFEGAVCAR